MEEWQQKMHVIEKLKHDIKSFPLRMLRARLLNAEKWELKTGGLEEKVSLLRLRYAQLNAKVRPTNEGNKTKTEVTGTADKGNRSR